MSSLCPGRRGVAAISLVVAFASVPALAAEPIEPFYEVRVEFACKRALDFEARVTPSGHLPLPGRGEIEVADRGAAAALFAVQKAYGEAVRRVVVHPTPNEEFRFERPTPPCR